MHHKEVVRMPWNARNGEVSIGSTKMVYAAFGHGSRTFVIILGLSDGLTTVRRKVILLAKPYTSFFDQFKVYMFSRKDDAQLLVGPPRNSSLRAI